MKKFILLAITFVATLALADQPNVSPVRTTVLFDDRTTTGNSSSVSPYDGIKTFQGFGAVSASTGSVTILIQGSNVDSSVLTDWLTLCTLTISLSTTSAGEGCVTDSNYRYYRARVSAISGTDASVDVLMGSRVQ